MRMWLNSQKSYNEGAEAESTAVLSRERQQSLSNCKTLLKPQKWQEKQEVQEVDRLTGSWFSNGTFMRHVSNYIDFCLWQCHGELVMHVFCFACYLKNLPNNRCSEHLADKMAAKHTLKHLQVDAVYKRNTIYKPLFHSCRDTSACAYKPDLQYYI